MKRNQPFRQIWYLCLLCILSGSCTKYLDAKSDKKLTIASTLDDLSLMMDNSTILNENVYPSFPQVSCDDYYLLASTYNALSRVKDKSNYAWIDEVTDYGDWSRCYLVVNYANIVLATLPDVPRTTGDMAMYNRVRGTALFFRAFAFFELLQTFAPAYDAATAATDPGICLRLNPDFNETSVRTSVQDGYNQVIKDLKEALTLLPTVASSINRPSSTAVYALLARIYLSMRNYQSASDNAALALQINSQLLDYNTLDGTASSPMPEPKFNPEVIFFSTSNTPGVLSASRAKIDSVLFQLYNNDDLRKTVFFRDNGNGTYAFKGSYQQTSANAVFNGLTTGELFLVKAESLLRLNEPASAYTALEELLNKRYVTGTYTLPSFSDPMTALAYILAERRKELVFRSLRWQDLKRLNKDNATATTLHRMIADQLYTLEPNSLKYSSMIPEKVISLSGIQQNSR